MLPKARALRKMTRTTQPLTPDFIKTIHALRADKTPSDPHNRRFHASV
jgi:hypothetical protein